MFVCSCCLRAIESHEGNQWSKKVDFEDVDENLLIEEEDQLLMKCEWCDELFELSEMYEI